MCFIHDNCIVLAHGRLYLLVNDRELLQGSYDDTLALVDGGKQVFRAFLSSIVTALPKVWSKLKWWRGC